MYIILIIAIVFSYFAMAFWFIWYKFEKPPFMPFLAFKMFCSCGNKKPLSVYSEIFARRSVYDLTNPEWRKWGEDIAERKFLTDLEAYCFNQRFIVEINKVLKDRKQGETV